jgi:hypothetical protein
MKTYKSSDLTHKRAEVLEEAEANGVIIQQLKTNGTVVKEFYLMTKETIEVVMKSEPVFPFGKDKYYER